MNDTKRNMEMAVDAGDLSDSEDEATELIYHDMELFCYSIDEPDLVDNFIKHKVTLGQILQFDEQDLINCGVNLVGQRKKILSTVGRALPERWSPTCLNDMTEQSMLSSPGIYLVLNDINRHLEYIGSSFIYFKKKTESRPEILELGKDFVGIKKIYAELSDLIRTSETMQAKLKTFRRQIGRKLNDPTLHPANHIEHQYTWLPVLGKVIIPAALFFVAFKACIRLPQVCL